MVRITDKYLKEVEPAETKTVLSVRLETNLSVQIKRARWGVEARNSDSIRLFSESQASEKMADSCPRVPSYRSLDASFFYKTERGRRWGSKKAVSLAEYLLAWSASGTGRVISSFLQLRTGGQGSPGRPLSQRVGRDWATELNSYRQHPI